MATLQPEVDLENLRAPAERMLVTHFIVTRGPARLTAEIAPTAVTSSLAVRLVGINMPVPGSTR